MSDIYFAAYLINEGFEIKTFKLVENRYMSFEFEITKEEMNKKKISFLKSNYNLIKRQIAELRSLGKN